jgi:K+-sensing histidine kinase KdpD
MSILDQSPRRLSRAVTAAAVAGATLTMARPVSRNRAAALAGLAAPLALTAVLIPFRASFPNTDAALALVLVVVAVAAAGRRLAGALAAVSAAAWFDFFLTVPYERFTITRHADAETTVLILAVGIAVTEIAVRGRRQNAAAARRSGYLDGINAAARAAATGAEPQLLIEQVRGQLSRLLGLAACRFQHGAAGIGNPPRLLRDGRITTAGPAWNTEHESLPPGRETELLVEAGGLLQGRFLLTPGPGARPSLEQRLVAIGLADQAGAALASARPAGPRQSRATA